MQKEHISHDYPVVLPQKTMSLQNICDFINSLPVSVDSLQMHDIDLFARRYDGPDAIDETVKESFQSFIFSLKSIRCILTNKLEIHMKRHFSKQEVLSGKVSRNMQTFLWNLGYNLIGAGLFEEAFESGKRNKVEALFFVDSAFRRTLPPVRSLQSITYEAVQDCYELNTLPEFLMDNPTISPFECLQVIKESVTYCDAKDFYGDKLSQSSLLYVAAKKDTVMSYYFTTCLLLIEQGVTVKYSSTSHSFENALLFDSEKLHDADILVDSLLQECMKDVADMSAIVKDSMHQCESFWGIVFQSPVESHYNIALLRQVISCLTASDSKYLDKCFVNLYSHNPPEECRDCQELEAVHQACIIFLLGAVNRYWQNNFQ